MAMIQSGMTLISRFLPVTIDTDGTMDVTISIGWYDDGGTWHVQSSVVMEMTKADVAAIMQLPSDGTKSRYEDITNQLCLYAIAKGFATGTIVPEVPPS
jgi:hypothetical protein